MGSGSAELSPTRGTRGVHIVHGGYTGGTRGTRGVHTVHGGYTGGTRGTRGTHSTLGTTQRVYIRHGGGVWLSTR